MSILAKRMEALQPSATLSMAAKSRALKAAGKAIIDLSLGEPDFSTPKMVVPPVVRFLETGMIRYTAVPGTLALRQAVVDKLHRDNALTYTPEQIIISDGAKDSL